MMIDDNIVGYKQKYKKSIFLFGFVFNLHYLCSEINKERNNMNTIIIDSGIYQFVANYAAKEKLVLVVSLKISF